MDISGGFGMFKKSELERLFRDARAGRFHPANSALSHEVVGKLALGHQSGREPALGVTDGWTVEVNVTVAVLSSGDGDVQLSHCRFRVLWYWCAGSGFTRIAP